MSKLCNHDYSLCCRSRPSTSPAVLNTHLSDRVYEGGGSVIGCFSLSNRTKLSNISSTSVSKCQFEKLPYLCTWLNVMMRLVLGIGSPLVGGHMHGSMVAQTMHC